MPQQVNINKLIGPSEIKGGQEYYFMVGNKIKRGTAVQCDGCGKWCSANAHTILSFGTKASTIAIADIDEDELGYNEETDQCLCSDCQ